MLFRSPVPAFKRRKLSSATAPEPAYPLRSRTSLPVPSPPQPATKKRMPRKGSRASRAAKIKADASEHDGMDASSEKQQHVDVEMAPAGPAEGEASGSGVKPDEMEQDDPPEVALDVDDGSGDDENDSGDDDDDEDDQPDEDDDGSDDDEQDE